MPPISPYYRYWAIATAVTAIATSITGHWAIPLTCLGALLMSLGWVALMGNLPMLIAPGQALGQRIIAFWLISPATVFCLIGGLIWAVLWFVAIAKVVYLVSAVT
jgi:hypothetical protein